MNAILSPPSLRCVMLVLFGLLCVPLFASPAFAAATSTPILQANLMTEIMGDRARMIQISLVIVALGCAVMWWYR